MKMDSLIEWIAAIKIEEDTQKIVLSLALDFIKFANTILNNATFRWGMESKMLTRYILNYQKGFTEQFQYTSAIQIDYKQIIGFLKMTEFIMIVKYCLQLLLRYVRTTVNKQMLVAEMFEAEYLLEIVTTIAALSNILANSNDFEPCTIVDEVWCFVKNLLDFISSINQKGYQYQIYHFIEKLILVFKSNDQVQKFILNNIYEKLRSIYKYITRKDCFLSGCHMESLMHYGTIFKIVLQHRFAHNKNILCTVNVLYSEDSKYKELITMLKPQLGYCLRLVFIECMEYLVTAE